MITKLIFPRTYSYFLILCLLLGSARQCCGVQVITYFLQILNLIRNNFEHDSAEDEDTILCILWWDSCPSLPEGVDTWV